MPSPRTGHRVRHLVQEHLVRLIIIEPHHEMTGDGDAARSEVAQASPGFGVIETERPGGIQMQRDQGIRPPPHLIEFGHGRYWGSAKDSAIASRVMAESTSEAVAPMRTRRVTAARKSARAEVSSPCSK